MKRHDATMAGLGPDARPRAIRALNALGRRLPAGERWTVQGMKEEARQSVGASDFGPGDIDTPLAVLLDSVQDEARLHPIGRAITRGRIVNTLKNRLRIEKLIAAHPEIEDIPIEAPIVIAGLQRTGTTMLHRLLAADPRLRALSSWESLNPVPIRGPRFKGEDPRVLHAVLAEKGLQYMSPIFFAIHPVEARAPEEEVILLDHSFYSTVPEATLRVPAFSAWLEAQDHEIAYRYLKRMLQVLTFQRGAERWILKTPHHLEFLDPLLDVFPDARVIQTHRDPRKTTASLCSMITHGRAVFSDDVDPHEVGAHWFAKIDRMVARAMDTRDRREEGQFLDVSYYDLISDPMPQVERIYAHLGMSLTDAARDAMSATRRRNRKDKHGKHKYALEEFGLSAALVEEKLGAYRARFEIRVE